MKSLTVKRTDERVKTELRFYELVSFCNAFLHICIFKKKKKGPVLSVRSSLRMFVLFNHQIGLNQIWSDSSL